MTEKKSTALVRKEIQENVISKVQTFQELGQIKLPANYSPENAVRAAFLMLQDTHDRDKKPVLESCTVASIADSMLKMVVQGLNPMKGQCSFVAYGNKLTMQREYHGTIALAKRMAGIRAVIPEVIYEGDEFEFQVDTNTGRKRVTKHVQQFDNINPQKIRGAYCTLILGDGSKDVEIMTIAQIRAAWAMGKAKGQGPAHLKFPDQMAKKTVAARACKLHISTSSDDSLFDVDTRTFEAHDDIADEAMDSMEPLDMPRMPVFTNPDKTTPDDYSVGVDLGHQEDYTAKYPEDTPTDMDRGEELQDEQQDSWEEGKEEPESNKPPKGPGKKKEPEEKKEKEPKKSPGQAAKPSWVNPITGKGTKDLFNQ